MSGTARDSASETWPLAGRVALGIATGCFAGILQVLAAQVVGGLVGRRERADIAPRFVQRLARLTGRSPARPARWSLATLFHFAYATGWGTAYALVSEAVGVRRVPPFLAGGLLGALIYAVAFSRFGAGTLTGSEHHPDRRGESERMVQWTSALTFAWTLTYTYRWLRGRK